MKRPNDINYAYHVHNDAEINKLSKELKLERLKFKSTDMKRFAIYYIPLILIGLGVIGNKLTSISILDITANINIADTSNIEANTNIASSSAAPSPLAGSGGIIEKFPFLFLTCKNKKFNLLKLLKYSILILFIISLILKFFFNINYSYNLILTIMSTINMYLYSYGYWIKYFILAWILGWIFFYLLLYIKYRYYFEVEIINVPKYLPNCIINTIDDFNRHSKKPELKNNLEITCFKILKFHSVVCFLYICILLFIGIY